MHLSLLCQHFYPEMISTGMHMTELAMGLSKLGWQITVYCSLPSLSLESENPNVPGKMVYQSIQINRVPAMGSYSGGVLSRLMFGLTYLVTSSLAVLRHHKEFDGLLITTNPPFLGIAGWLAKLVVRKPYVMIVYDIYPDIAVRLCALKKTSPITWIWERISRLILKKASSIVVIGRDMKQRIDTKMNGTGQHSIHFIPNWSDEKTVFPVPRDKNKYYAELQKMGYWLIQYSGRMAKTHNLEPLVEAAELLKDKLVIFQFIGDGAKKRQLQDMVIQKNLTNVQFLPYQPIERLGEVLSAADLGVVCLETIFTGLSVPSKAYGIMASATPILGFLDPSSEIGLTIKENDCGVVLRDPTGAQVAEVIEKLISNPDQLRAMGVRGYEAFKKNFSLSRAAEQYSDLLKDAFSNPL